MNVNSARARLVGRQTLARVGGGVALFALLAFFTGVSLAGSETGDAADKVRERASGYWQAMVEGDYAAAYGFLSAGSKTLVSERAFARRFEGQTQWKSWKISGISCEDEVCAVDLEAAYRFSGRPPFPPFDGKKQSQDKWILSDGDWWLVLPN